jgi:hypothetical protein
MDQITDHDPHIIKDSDLSVPSVPRRQPHFTAGGVLVIPFDSDPKYHWWRGGQSVADSIAELRNSQTHAELSLNLKQTNNP